VGFVTIKCEENRSLGLRLDRQQCATSCSKAQQTHLSVSFQAQRLVLAPRLRDN